MIRTIIDISAAVGLGWILIAIPVAAALGKALNRASRLGETVDHAPQNNPDRAPVNLAGATYVPAEWINV